MRMPPVQVRDGSVGDLHAALSLLDEAVRWLVAQGRTGQWGEKPFSEVDSRVAQIRSMLADRTARIAVSDGQVVGVCVMADEPMPYIEAGPVPELYLQLLVTDRKQRGAGIGRSLVEDAVEIARARDVGLLRLDCYAGNDRALVRAYERLGFILERTFTVDTGKPEPWPGALMRMEV